MKPHLFSRLFVTAAVVAFLGGTAAVRAQIFQFTFNDSGTTTASTGSNTASASLISQTSNLSTTGTATDLHSAGGLGVSGAAGDKALDLTEALGMGNDPTGTVGPQGLASLAGATASAALNGAKSFTIQGWFKTDTSTNPTEAAGGNAKLISYINGSVGFDLYAAGGNVLTFSLNNATTNNSLSSSLVSTAGAWVFFAVTYDSGTVKLYTDTVTGSAITTAAATGSWSTTLSPNTLSAPTNALTIGDNSGGRQFDGLMDDIRIYASNTDSSGALGATQLEALRQTDLTVAPEPSSLALGAFGALLGGGWLFRRRLLARA